MFDGFAGEHVSVLYFMYIIPERGAATLLPIDLKSWSIPPGITMMSDLWTAYGGIKAMGYTHVTVNHNMEL